MKTVFQRLFRRDPLSTLNVPNHLKNKSRPRSLEHSRSLGFERLEPRVLLAGFDFGDITDPARLYAVNDQVPADFAKPLTQLNTADVYTFSLQRTAVLIAALSDLRPMFLFDRRTGAELHVFSDGIEANDASTVFASKDFSEGTTGNLRVSLSPGTYSIAVNYKTTIGVPPISFLKSYDLSIHADTAPVEFTSGNPRATVGRNLGPLSTASGIDIQEYIGIGNSGIPSTVEDQVDMYLFELVKQGTVEVKVTSGVLASGAVDFTLFRDSNGDGVFEDDNSFESLATRTGITSGETKTISRVLEPGRYGIAVFVNPQTATQAQDDDYGLRTTYTVADGAGNTLAAARPVGPVDNFFKTFSDYISPNDEDDIYKFDSVGNGPFVFEGTLTGMRNGSNFELDFIRDLDSDGAIDLSEVTSSDRNGNAFEELAAPYITAGTFFVRVRHTAGEGVYTLRFKNRNTDLAGNTMTGAAKNLGNFVFNDLADQVSSLDKLDFYKFELAVPSDFDVSMTEMPAGTDADLLLIHSKNGDSNIDKGEIIGRSDTAGNASETIQKTLTPGVYFVRVKHISGTPTYKLRLVHDRVGNSFANAQPISIGGGSNLDFLGPEDNADVYKFSMGATRQVGVKVELNTEPLLIRLGQDTNGNGQLDDIELRLSKTMGAGTGGFERVNLAGESLSFLLVNRLVQDEGTLYRVTLFNANPDNAGNNLSDARDINTLGDAQVFSDLLGRGPIVQMDDLNDFYKFKLGENGPFQFVSQFSNVAGIVGFQLIRDDNQNQQIDSGEILVTVISPIANAPPPPISIGLDVRDTYYLKAFSTNAAAYTVNMRAISLDTAGNSLAGEPPPLDLGTLANTINIANQIVGRIDLDDFFRFSINKPGELVASLSGAENTLYHVIRDVDRNGVVDSGETLAIAFGSRPLHGVFLPVADDNYFVRVQAVFGDALYDLNLTFSNQTPVLTPLLISATDPTEIKLVRFDNGGEGVSWHDTTPDNTGDQPEFRNAQNIDVDVSSTVDVTSLGRRVTNTAPGEFLEYTINVAEGGFYDFDVRVSSPDLGATFHLEIDDVSLSLPVTVPDTGGDDNMVTIAGASNAGLTAGPHILRLVIDTGTGVNNDFAGSFNFIKVRPASTGTFELAPISTTVAAWTHTNLSLSWTVPVGGWRTLRQVDLRLRNDCGNVIWIRFDEANNTMSLFKQSRAEFGHAKQVGSNRVLQNPLARVFMKTTTIAANGPDDPTVVIAFDMMFKGRARGHWTIEASASDDLGHRDPFKYAGELNVV